MSYINVGAFINNERPKSKAALKRAMKEAPETVRFDCTTFIGPDRGRVIKGTDIPEGDILSVCGPDPYAARNWFGNVKHGRNGIVVS